MKSTSLATLMIIAFVILGTGHHAIAQPNYPTNPDKAQLIYSDVENFVKAFEKLQHTTDTIAVLNKYYFDEATPGLKEYISRHKLTPVLLKAAIQKDPERYHKIAGFLENQASFQLEFKKTMQQFSEVLPTAMYPPTYLLVGANRGIAQASKFGQLVTVTKVLDREVALKKLIVHELAHFQQAISMGIQTYGALYASPNNMLGLCLREGGAEFVTSLVLNDITQAKGLEYFLSHESQLKTRFIEDLSQQDAQYWLWDSLDDHNTPALLGYVMGFKICDAYYQRASNKENALKEILLMTTPETVLELSKFLE